MQFLCVSQDEIDRVVTLQTSGTSGEPKRLFFTAKDLELTVGFFHRGMATLTEPGWGVLILMPGPKPASIGDLLSKVFAAWEPIPYSARRRPIPKRSSILLKAIP